MVRINCGIEPSALADQHLIAEYREHLLAFGYYRKHPNLKPAENNLMHPICFYKDKLTYLEKRFNQLKEEMISRGFKPLKNLEYNGINKNRFNDWEPQPAHIERIRDRIIQRLNEKPTWYRYHGKYKYPKFFVELMNG